MTVISCDNSVPRSDAGLLSTRGGAVLCMSLSLAVHLGGYELARAAVTALFTSDGLGFGAGDGEDGGGGLSALPLAVACVSPFSVALLWVYGATLDAGGPARALRAHTLACAGAQFAAGWACAALDQRQRASSATTGPFTDARVWSRLLLFVLFVFQNSCVLLLWNQHWAFLTSVLAPEEGARLFAPISGLGSVLCTLAAGSVSLFVEWFGLIGLLHVAGTAYVISALLADRAFGIAANGGFEPRRSLNMHVGASLADQKRNGTVASAYPAPDEGRAPSGRKKENIFRQAHILFRREPVLKRLFAEVLVSQCLSSLVNFIYLYSLKTAIHDDAARAGWSGHFYAWINGVSGVLQFLVLPALLRCCDARRLWLVMPALMLCCTLPSAATAGSPGLLGAGAAFFIIKTMEYSLRGVANEMLYVGLDFESRYLGKKVISLIAGKLGKSIVSAHRRGSLP